MSESGKGYRYKKVALGAMMALIGAVYFVFSYFVPEAMDDLMFKSQYLELGNGNGLTWDGLMDFAEFLRHTDNSRLCNVLWPVYGMFAPKWVTAMCIALAAVELVWLLTNIMGGMANVWRVGLVWGMVAFGLPWQGDMMTGVFASNYLFGSVFSLWFVWLLIRSECRLGVGAVIVALLAGMMHEGFSTAVIGGGGIWILYKRFRLSHEQWVLTLAYVAASVWTLTAPGIMLRMGVTRSNLYGLDLRWVMTLWPLWALMAAWCMALLRKWRKGMVDETLIMLTAAALVAFVQTLVIGDGYSRALWIVDLFALAGLLRFVGKLLTEKVGRFADRIVTLATAAFYCGVVYWQIRATDDYNRILALYRESESGSVYYDCIGWAPRYTLHHPVAGLWDKPWHVECFNRLVADDRKLMVLPATFADVDMGFDNMTAIGDGVRSYNGCILMADRSLGLTDEGAERLCLYVQSVRLIFEYSDLVTEAVLKRFVAPTGERLIAVVPLRIVDLEDVKKIYVSF